jgi:hypothetical protein
MAEKRIPKSELKKVTETAKPKVKITGSASTPPRVSSSMINSQPKTSSQSNSLTGPAAITELQRQVSSKGVSTYEDKARKLIYESTGITVPLTRTTAGVKKK